MEDLLLFYLQRLEVEATLKAVETVRVFFSLQRLHPAGTARAIKNPCRHGNALLP